MKRFSALLLMSLLISLGSAQAATINATATPAGSYFLEGTQAIGVDGDAAPGFGVGSIKAPNAYSRYMLDPEVAFGHPVTVGSLSRISFLTKKGTLHTVSQTDWFLYMYTDPFVGGHSSWYGHRINAEPYFSQNLVETAGAWNQWTSSSGANNRLRFYDASPPANSAGTYTDGFLSDIANSAHYSAQTILMMGLSVPTTGAASFSGQVDGLIIELTSGEILRVDFESGHAGTVAMTPATSGPINCSQSQTVTVNLTKTAGVADVFGFNAVVRADGPITWGPVTNLAAFGASTLFFSFDQGDGSYAISGTTVGSPTHPISGAGTTPLFSIQYSPSGTGTGNITFDSFTLRDPSNATIPSVATGATFSIDCDAPAAVTGISATTGHNKINVAWSHSGSDVNHYEVYAGLWHDGSHASAYPEYDDMAADVIPSRPASRAAAAASADWALVASPATTSSLQSWADNLHRGVYYYEVFAVDAAGNASAAASAGDRATNYWLGDVSVPFDGMVAVGDISRLGATFGLAGGAGGYDNESDVGPTDDNSGIGIPSTDSRINFEDLMIFALNFGVAGPSKALGYDHTAPVLAWTKVGDGAWALQLSTPCAALKGLHLTGVADGQIVAVPGALLADQSNPVMFELGTGLDINLAVMGSNLGMSGSGELLRIEGISDISSIVVDARGLDNAALKAEISVGTQLPGAFAVRPNYPNPFNPQTTISFDMSRTGPVQVGIFDLGGRCVRTLLNESRAAGTHTVLWNGMDDAGKPAASGTYLYRVRTDGQEVTRKMLLMK